MSLIEGQVALVTGGGSGIGRAVVARFIEEGALFGAKAALPELMKTEGSMVFTASVAGLNPGGGGTLYTASKHAAARSGSWTAGTGQWRSPGRHDDRSAGVGRTQSERSLAIRRPWDGAAAARRQSIAVGTPARRSCGVDVFLSSRTNARGITGTTLTVDAGSMLRVPRRSRQNR